MISIIGAGPAGSYLAYLLSKNNYEVNVYEEHKEIGKPIQCSGVITSALDNLINIKEDIIINKITKVRFYAPNNTFFETKIKPDYVFDRAKLDKYIADMAKKEGAKFIIGRFLNMEKNNGKRKFITGIQARAKTKRHDKDVVDIFLGYGEFGWLIPEDDYTARIGVVAEKNPLDDFKRLMEKCNAKFLEYQSGMIPLYNSKIKAQKDNIYLLGDAATIVKASTHGGILYSMLAGKALTESITKRK